MQNYINILAHSEIMQGILPEDIASVLSCLKAHKSGFLKGSAIYQEGSKAPFMGIVLSGTVSVSKTDFFGNKNIILKIDEKGVFAETAAFSSTKRLPYAVEAETDCLVLFIDALALTKVCCLNCPFHKRLLDNAISAIANRNIELTKKISILSARSIREKILELLNLHKKEQQSKTITLNMSRQQMADFLSVDRSALSRELSALQREKVIDFYKNTFKLL